MRLQFLSASSFPLPASRNAIRIRFHGFDFFWALVSPLLALDLTNAYVLRENNGLTSAIVFCVILFLTSAVSLVVFRVHDGVARYFSVHDALVIGKAVIATELMGCVILFTATRLEGIPRSAPVVHALLFGVGLLTARTLARVTANDRAIAASASAEAEHIVLLGANELSSFYIKLVQSCALYTHNVVAVLDSRYELFGRAIEGVPIVGSTEHLDSILSEYAIHGIEIGRIVVAGNSDDFPAVEMAQVRTLCDKRKISLDLLPRLLNLHASSRVQGARSFQISPANIRLSPYFKWKRVIDFCGAVFLLLVFFPIFVFVSLLVMADSGLPVLFWQQRLGLSGSRFLLYKFRTLRAPFDVNGKPIAPACRLSKVGQVLRETSLDELPQILNILVGDMSLIGPRPLLPEDQPRGQSIRLSVRPGITGWAQIHGGKLLTAEEKDALDEWYIRNASLFVDIQILIETAKILLFRARSREGSVDEQSIASRKMGQGEANTRSHPRSSAP